MVKRILVPLDDSARAYEALALARALALECHATLTLLRVEPWGSPGDSVRKDHVDLDTQVERLRAEGLDARAVVLFDEPEDGITTTALLEEADLVALAPQVREGFDALMHPSVTARMLSRSPAPLLIVPDSMPYVAAAPLLVDPTARILVPLDGSQRAEQALILAMDLARTFDREMLLARAAPPPTHIAVQPEVYVPTSELASSTQQEAVRYLETAAAQVKEAGLRVRRVMLMGPPALDLTALIAKAHVGLVVMSTHGRTGAARMLLGSVARHLIYHATTPLIVLPPRYLAHIGAALEREQTSAR
jgi:nucleotide-binding universal stress UspA family protein